MPTNFKYPWIIVKLQLRKEKIKCSNHHSKNKKKTKPGQKYPLTPNYYNYYCSTITVSLRKIN